jgi:alanyl-tRNA synthetase
LFSSIKKTGSFKGIPQNDQTGFPGEKLPISTDRWDVFIPMTQEPKEEKLYLGDAYQTSFQANVLSCCELPGSNYAVILDATYFYPESGGQLCDTGTIGDAEVVSVREDDAGKVIHVITEPVSGEIHCEIDWDRRFDHMQQHTGQHVLTRAFIEIAGMPTVSFHMGDDACTIDIEGGELDEGALDAAENLSNAIIWEDRSIRVRTIPVSEVLEGTLRRSLPEGITEARLVEVEDFDAVACCGTHVGRTGELGVIKVIKQEKVKGNTRIYYKTGRRAFWDYQDKHDITKALSNRFTTSPDGILEKTEKLAGDAQRLRREHQKLKKRLAELDKVRILTAGQTHNKIRLALHMSEDDDEEYMNVLANNCRSGSDTIVFLGSKSGHIVCAASRNLEIELAALVIEKAGEVGGKGGGKGGFVRVSIPPSENVENFLQKVCDHVKENL